MNERIKKVRKALDLTQQEFGDRIGIKRNSLALIENGRNTSEQTIFAICREFNVNEEWLRTGKGEMFNPEPTDALDALASEYNLTHMDYIFLEKLLKNRKLLSTLEDFCIDTGQALSADDVHANTKAFPNTDLSELTIDEKVELYRQELEAEEKVKEKSEASQRNA